MISKSAFSHLPNFISIQFSPNSELQTIEKDAFHYSSFESIFVPASLTDLKEYWCNGTEKLINIKIDQRNLRYSNYEDIKILCKTSETSESQDKIVFIR